MPDIDPIDDGWIPAANPVEVQAVGFEDGGVSISYVEENDTSPDVMVVKTIMIRRRVLGQSEYEETLDTLRSWIDHGFGLLRQHRNK